MDKDQQGRVCAFDPKRFAELSASTTGTIKLADLRRVLSVVFDTRGTIGYQVSGHCDTDGARLIKLSLNANPGPRLQCQRCLEAFEFPISSTTVFELVGDEALFERVSTTREPLLERPLALETLVEDEVLLALPQEPKHDDSAQCASPVGSREFTTESAKPPLTQRPFAGLSDLLKD